MPFADVFEELKLLLERYAPQLELVHNTNEHYYLNTPGAGKKPEFFGAVQIKKAYVSFHLMPVYYHPELLEGVSEALKKKMQGKSCFNFKNSDPTLFSELGELTERAFALYRSLKQL